MAADDVSFCALKLAKFLKICNFVISHLILKSKISWIDIELPLIL